MKIVFLNTWRGKMGDNLSVFIKSRLADTDVFCFMEMIGPNIWQICHRLLLPDYQVVKTHKSSQGQDFAQSTYVRRHLDILSKTTLLTNYENSGLALATHLKVNSRNLFICNVHGISQPGDKLDTPGRLKQSSEIIDFLADKKGMKIVGGDFNLLPETESVKMFEKASYQNLIKNYKIKSTRNHLAWDRFPGNKQVYADFTFVSPDVNVKSFSVPDIEASDHLPQILDIAL